MILSLCPNPSIDTYAWLESFQQGKVNRIERTEEYPGGKGVHVALALAELGAPVTLSGNWAGMPGEWIKEECKKKKISLSGIRLEGNNRKCYTFRSSVSAMDNSELLEPGPSMTAEKWLEFRQQFQADLQKVSLAVMSGSWPKNAPVDAYKQLLEAAKLQQVKVILDCSGKQLEEALKTEFFGLHLNESEALALCGSSELKKLADFLQGKVQLLALTRGKDGLELYYQGEVFKANVVLDEVKSTVGSGDCLTAGIAYALSMNMSGEEIARYGVACGAANCLHEALGMLEKKTVERLLPKVHLKRIK